MKQYPIVYARSAIADLDELRSWVAKQTTERTATRYLSRIRSFCRRLRNFPERGESRDDLRPGIRLIGFEGRIDVAFEVQNDRVVIIRVLYAGRQFAAG